MFHKQIMLSLKFKEISAWCKSLVEQKLITSAQQKRLKITLGNNLFNILWCVRKEPAGYENKVSFNEALIKSPKI